MMSAIEKRMYEDIHKIAISLGKIEHHLSVIAEAHTPVYVDFGEMEPVHSFHSDSLYNPGDISFDSTFHVDDGK